MLQIFCHSGDQILTAGASMPKEKLNQSFLLKEMAIAHGAFRQAVGIEEELVPAAQGKFKLLEAGLAQKAERQPAIPQPFDRPVSPKEHR